MYICREWNQGKKEKQGKIIFEKSQITGHCLLTGCTLPHQHSPSGSRRQDNDFWVADLIDLQQQSAPSCFISLCSRPHWDLNSGQANIFTFSFAHSLTLLSLPHFFFSHLLYVSCSFALDMVWRSHSRSLGLQQLGSNSSQQTNWKLVFVCF